MSKPNDDSEDDFDSEGDGPSQESNPASGPNSRPAFTQFSSNNNKSSFGGGMGMFDSRSNPFSDMGFGGPGGFGMGAGFGGGFDRFGSNLMGMRFSDHDGHMHRPSDRNN